MRTILPIVAIVAVVSIAGCAGTGDTRRPAPEGSAPSRPVPVVQEQPTLSDRLRYSRQQKAEHSTVAMTTVTGDVKR